MSQSESFFIRVTGIKSRIELWEAKNNVEIDIKKLFIPIPSSCHIPTDLREIDDFLENIGVYINIFLLYFCLLGLMKIFLKTRIFHELKESWFVSTFPEWLK